MVMSDGDGYGCAEFAYASPGDLATVRSFVRRHSAGLATARADLLVLAVSELASNTLQHTTSGGLVRLCERPTSVICEVIDAGSADARPRDGAMPAAGARRGRGLAIVHRVCDEVAVFVRGGLTVVRLRMNR
jgi:serine/threonine-protein kinase RsbW